MTRGNWLSKAGTFSTSTTSRTGPAEAWPATRRRRRPPIRGRPGSTQSRLDETCDGVRAGSKDFPMRREFSGTCSYVRNCWYVAGWDYEVPQDTLFQRTIIEESILLYRTSSGKVVALDNKCCHRHAPLSAGRKEDDCVRCMYHGLKYDQEGRCIEIPGQTHIPANVRVRSYPVVERKRWIWIWMGNPDEADPTLIPDTFSLQDPA